MATFGEQLIKRASGADLDMAAWTMVRTLADHLDGSGRLVLWPRRAGPIERLAARGLVDVVSESPTTILVNVDPATPVPSRLLSLNFGR